MAVTNEQVIARYLEEAGRSDSHFLTRGTYTGWPADWERLLVTVEPVTQTLFVHVSRMSDRTRANGTRPREVERIPMVQFAGHRHQGGVFVVNGDGFTSDLLNTIQQNLRQRTRQTLGNNRMALLPYAALTGAQIDRTSVRPIEISEDTNQTWVRFLGGFFDPGNPLQQTPPAVAELMQNPPAYMRETAQNRYNLFTYELPIDGEQYRITVRRDPGADPILEGVQIWAMPEFGRYAWQNCRWTTERRYTTREGKTLTGSGWFWTETVHRLGSVVFSAVTAVDGRRHRYLSAFDMQEPQGLYFLAMLPDRGPCKSYGEALDLLAPDMVHQARKDGKRVYRQGDVFAIETTRSNEQVYNEAVTRVRRDVALQDPQRRLASGLHLLPFAEGEVTDLIDCPFCTGHAVQAGCGPNARQALSIHRTGHTADEVVVKEGGVTYIRGQMYHDPWIENPERVEADHQPIQLGPTPTTQENLSELPWFVAIRNTVPKLRPLARPNEDSQIVATATDTPQLRERQVAMA